MKTGNDSLTLFSRVSGTGVTGFSHHPVLPEEEITIQESDTPPVEDKNGAFCHYQQHCLKPIKCERGKCQKAHATIDLWF